ncbi:MAG: hypothetical protein U0235_35210 [Polyangiaceae bacterium]
MADEACGDHPLKCSRSTNTSSSYESSDALPSRDDSFRRIHRTTNQSPIAGTDTRTTCAKSSDFHPVSFGPTSAKAISEDFQHPTHEARRGVPP